jgi:hypothetical protein
MGMVNFPRRHGIGGKAKMPSINSALSNFFDNGSMASRVVVRRAARFGIEGAAHEAG